MDKYKVYVTEVGLVPVDETCVKENSGIIQKLLFFPKENDKIDKTCAAWVVPYYDKCDFNFKPSETGKRACPPLFRQDLFKDTKHDDFLPIIHMSKYNLIGEDNQLEEADIVRYSKIVDSSIWNYYVKYEIDFEKKTVIAPILDKVVRSIRNNYKKGKYYLSVSREYANLNYRLVKESWLDGAHGEHVSPFIFHSEQELEKLIESEFNVKNRMSKKTTIDIIKEQKWRILLVDDKAVKEMKSINDKMVFGVENGLKKTCKMAIVKSLLMEHFIDNEHHFCYYKNEIKDDSHTTFFVEYADNVTDAQNKIREKKYDIILLDYLLEPDTYNKTYGYELLESIYKEVALKRMLDDVNKLLFSSSAINESVIKEIYDIIFQNKNAVELLNEFPYHSIFSDVLGNICINALSAIFKKFSSKDKSINLLNEFKANDNLCEFLNKETTTSKIRAIRERVESVGYKIGPRKRLFFIFISAYSSAVYERLLAEGLNQSEDYWFISVGACPTNTPQLFLYNLTKLMEKRLDDSGILKLSPNEIYKLINKIYTPKEKDPQKESVRKRANAFYQEVLSLQYHYRSILKDVEIPFGQNSSLFDTKGSVLMTNFIQNRINPGGMLEHLTQLIHITAFGTIRQWPEMWEEYIYFKAQFEKQLDDVSTDDFNTLCQNIENYILELKSQQQ